MRRQRVRHLDTDEEEIRRFRKVGHVPWVPFDTKLRSTKLKGMGA